MPKVKVQVQATTVVELDLPEGFPSEADLKEFRENIFDIEDGVKLIEHIASQVATYRVDFVEGVGEIKARILESYTDYSDIVT